MQQDDGQIAGGLSAIPRSSLYKGELVAGWQLSDDEVVALAVGRHSDPFAVLGPHEFADGLVVRAFVPGASTLAAETPENLKLADLTCRDPGGLFEGIVPGNSRIYRLRAANQTAEWTFEDPYRYGPLLGQMDDYLYVEGTHLRLWDKLGARPIHHEGTDGVHFAVWAPHARRVSIVGDFNNWDGRRHPMRKRVDTGVWEIFCRGSAPAPITNMRSSAPTARCCR